MRKYLLVCACGLALVVPALSLAQDEGLSGGSVNAGGFNLGLGLVIDGEYNDMLKTAYYDRDISGGYGWLDLYLGYDIPVSPSVSVTPTVSLWFNFVADGGGDSFANTIILPAVQARYLFQSAPSFFVSGELNYSIPESGSDRIEFEDGGVGWGAFLGYEAVSGLRVELGYNEVPTTVTLIDRSGWYREQQDRTLGGFIVRLTSSF